ncbi:MAG: hypothetical protein LC679_17185 [Intrasporangiaceae bacterium]|nr:hypothetical protein [Intrasporangiaceae bacterium]
MRERYVLLGLARARADWFRTVGRWSTSASLPAEFIRCVSAEELRARLASGRAFSAALVDGSTPGVDRDLIAMATASGCAVLVVDDGRATRDWRELGAAAVLASAFSRDELLEVLAATSMMVGAATVDDVRSDPRDLRSRGRLIAVTGPGGTGASVTAIALAQGLASGEGRRASPGRKQASRPPSVLLADLCRTADQAMLHDSRVVVPGVQELVEAHRTSTPLHQQLLDQTFEVPQRGYRLVLGLRRSRHWVAIRPRAFDATLDSLQRLVDVVVADVDPDVEGEADAGSRDVEERNLLSRATLTRADAALVVGESSMKGLFALVRTLSDLLGLGVPVDRLIPVISRSPRSPRQRAEISASLAELLSSSAGMAADRLVAPVHIPTRDLDTALRDGVALPGPGPRILARSVAAVLDRAAEIAPEPAASPVPVPPGSLSAFTSQEPPRS